MSSNDELTSEDECVDVSIYATNRKKLSPGRQLPKPRILDSSDSEDSEAEEKKSLIDTPRTRKYHFINIYCHYYYYKYICNKF
jgi:hypothetical protein